MLNLLLLSATWNTAYEESPANTDTPSEGDDKIRDVKVEVRTRLEKEHGWGGSSTADGWHLAGSAFPYYQSAAPTNRADAATALDSDDAGRMWIDSDDNYLRTWDGDSFEIVCAGAYVAATAPTGISGADDTGALYIDSDDENLHWWNGSAWVDVDVANADLATLATTATTATGVNDVGGGNDLLCKVVNIGDWNMDSTTSVNVAHGVTFAQIRGVTAIIRNDTNSAWFPLPATTAGIAPVGNDVEVDIALIDTTNVTLQRVTSGDFDSTDFDSTSYNRGYVTIWYAAS